MPAFLSGLPLHVLLVHAVVVLVPLSVLGAITIALWPAARRRFGWLVVGITAVATAFIPLTTSSGDELKDRVVPTALIEEHAHLGDGLLIFQAALLVFSAALVLLAGSQQRRSRLSLRIAVPVIAVLTIGFAVISGIQVFRIGESGARAAWGEVHYTAPQPHHPGEGD